MEKNFKALEKGGIYETRGGKVVIVTSITRPTDCGYSVIAKFINENFVTSCQPNGNPLPSITCIVGENPSNPISLLRLGKTYKNRNGEEVKIVRMTPVDGAVLFIGDNDSIYMSNGKYFSTHENTKSLNNFDLVEEINDRNFTTLKVGRSYKDRDGDIVKILRPINDGDDNNEYSFWGRDSEGE